MGKINAYCKICGKGYHMCLSCKDYAKMRPWQQDTDTSEHYKVFQILKGNTIGVYSKEEARERLLNVDLSDKDSFVDNIKKRVDEILAEEKQEEIPVQQKPKKRNRNRTVDDTTLGLNENVNNDNNLGNI